jgi:DNA polymerase elongation subunit (family B)
MYLCKQHPKKLRQNTLAAACAAHLPPGTTKHDMPYAAIPGIAQGSNPHHWAALIGYCIQDSELVIKLLLVWRTVPDLVAQSRVISILMATNTMCGQQQRVRNSLLRKARRQRPPLIMNGVNARGLPGRPGQGDPGGDPAPLTADGGCVLDNVAGLHDVPVVVLDFASLYPSVQRSRNLCWSTVVTEEVLATLSDADRKALGIREYVTTTGTFHFVTNVTGVFPAQLRDLLQERKAAKKDMEDADVALKAAVAAGDDVAAHAARTAYSNADMRQRGTKIVMNSGYGTANASQGLMPCRAVGTVTCMVGAQLNATARTFVETKFGARTLYGDTDSIMVTFPEPAHLDPNNPTHRLQRLQHAIRMGEQAEHALNCMFHDLEVQRRDEKARATGADPEPVEDIVKTEHEKTYFPYHSIQKKVYTGMKFVKDPGPDANPCLEGLGSIEAKGVKMVRRDVAGFTRALSTGLLDALLKKRSLTAFWDTVRDFVLQVCLGPAEFACGGVASAASAASASAASASAAMDWTPSKLPPLPLSAFTLTQELKEGFETKAVVTAQAAVTFAAEHAVPGSGPKVGDRVVYVFVTTADTRRLKPPGAPRTGGCIKDETKRAAHARSVAEVMQDPSSNIIDIEHYVNKGVCSVVKQLLPGPETNEACRRAVSYARAAKAAIVGSRGPSTSQRALWAHLKVVSTKAPSARDTATILRSLPPLVLVRRNFFGGSGSGAGISGSGAGISGSGAGISGSGAGISGSSGAGISGSSGAGISGSGGAGISGSGAGISGSSGAGISGSGGAGISGSGSGSGTTGDLRALFGLKAANTDCGRHVTAVHKKTAAEKRREKDAQEAQRQKQAAYLRQMLSGSSSNT